MSTRGISQVALVLIVVGLVVIIAVSVTIATVIISGQQGSGGSGLQDYGDFKVAYGEISTPAYLELSRF